MKYGILGDIHSNLEALQAVLDECRRQGVDRVLSVGDVVGYGAAPRECLALLLEADVQIVKGNHDAACTGELDLLYFNPYAREAVLWTTGQLTSQELKRLSDLPLTIDLEHCSVAHGTYHEPERFDYVQSTDDANSSLDHQPRLVCFVGHTHVPVTLLRTNDDPYRTGYTLESEVEFRDVSRALVNVGSVGQPCDENPLAALGIYDTDANLYRLHRLTYDVEREAKRIRDAGLPHVLADRLHLGV